MRFSAILSGLKLVTLCGFVAAGPAFSEDLAAPKSDAILTVSGQIEAKNTTDAAQFDLELLAGLGAVDVKTSTIWTEGVHTFTGVPLKTLVTALGISQGKLLMTAVNDYMVEVPFSDAVESGPILAFQMDGQPMSVRDKGPIWLIYPYDSNVVYQSEIYYSRSIWQLNRIEAVN